MRGKRVCSALTALMMTGTLMLTPAMAAQLYGNPVIGYTTQGNNIVLNVSGLDQRDHIYAAQITLELKGEYPNVGLTASKGTVEVENRVNVSGGTTTLNVYLDAQTPLNNNTQIQLGALNLEQKGAMPSQAKVTFLDASLERMDATVRVRETGGGSSSGGGSSGSSGSSSGSSSSSTEAKVNQTGKGSVKVSPERPSAGDKVTITTTPDKGYQVDTVTVADKIGKAVDVTKVREDTYTFLQPQKAPVTIQVSFKTEEGQTPPSVGEMPFTDVKKGDWFYTAAGYVYENGLMSGTSQTTFGPNITTTRGMIVTILHQMEGKPTATGVSFQDVAPDQYYAKAVTWAASNGVVSGYGEGKFGPNDTITREQMAAILYRYAQYKGYDLTKSADLSTFADVDQVSSYAVKAMSWANGTGLINGMGENQLSPKGSATRAQAAAILMQFCEKIAK